MRTLNAWEIEFYIFIKFLCIFFNNIKHFENEKNFCAHGGKYQFFYDFIFSQNLLYVYILNFYFSTCVLLGVSNKK